MRVVPIGSKALVEDYLLYGWSSGRDMSAAELQVASWSPEQFDIAARDMMSNQEFLSWRALGRLRMLMFVSVNAFAWEL